MSATATITFDSAANESHHSQNSDEAVTAKVSKTAFSFMDKRLNTRVFMDDIDFTPDDIVESSFPTMMDTFSHAAFEVRVRSAVAIAKTDKTKADTGDGGPKVFATTISLDDIKIDHTLNTEEGCAPDDVDLDKAPSAFYLPKKNPIMSYPPNIMLVFKETETEFLFELPSFSFDKGTPEGNAVEEANEFYNYITVGKGRNRKMVVEETQTEPVVIQSRHTLAVRPQKKNAASFASLWDMHDTYEKLKRARAKEEPDEMVLYQSADAKLLRKKKVVDTGPDQQRGKTFQEIGQTHNFYDAVMLTERVLAAKAYSDAQKKFRGLVPMDPLSLDLVYIYTIKRLWTFECNETDDHPVVMMAFNPSNNNILAVAYGDIGCAKQFDGLVAIWCTKNPIKPERFYRFVEPLTSIAFSAKNPNWLACGFANGDVLILDVTSYSKKIIAQSTRDTNPCFESIWTVTWRAVDKDNEYVLTTCQDGRVNRFTSTKTHDFICTPMMRLSTVEGSLKGLQVTKACLKVDVPINRHPAGHCIMWHPRISHIYYVGTDEGCIHQCSKNYLNQHMDVFRAHAGPVYALNCSPFMKNLMMTCGADGAIRLWVEGIDDVIMTLSCKGAVYDAAFCPVNATIVLTVSTNILSIWDLRRKTHIPCAEYTLTEQGILTSIKFGAGGDSVFVSDSVGKIHTFHLEDTPIPPFDQRKMLDDAIKKALCTRPNLLKQLEKMASYQKRRP
ncbi:LOW QUALITY PROTEIN: dynein axonemal intermediate chain 4 [Cydia pomonella]|uniref:LOW QUALITY PROTEIN: dynein axonemal intermediate chain 4 n=1 Tax=Cydia pomonella TaxID=82600 RepID=UPI002ADE0144|nr:LOW QUALITY PROTEIN: dynein axonemal intermediate chain 4 [Cydia pomonella]